MPQIHFKNSCYVYAMNLKMLSDEEALKGTEDIVAREREITAEVIAWLREVEDRKLYCDKGCGSLFLYCVKVLKYSEPSAQRRTDAVKLSREVPGICEKVKSGELSLTVVSQAHVFFRKEAIGLAEKKEIIENLSHKSCRASERELLKHSSQPEIHIPDRVKPVSQTHSQIHFVASDEQIALFEKARGLLANANPEMSWADLFQKITEIALKKIDPLQRTVPPARKLQDPNMRTPNTGLKFEIFKKADGKCQNCGSSYRLNYDHIESWALGGETTAQNMRLYCRNCNERHRIRVFGKR
jgi:5-methylcytosine-specific restriction endonuclease McrA